jgi:hypothetical protein
MLICGDCKQPVVIKDNVIVRSCNHTGSIIANLTAKVKAHGNLK